MAHVFVSYAHVDSEFAENLIYRLRDSGFSTWIDSDIAPGMKWSSAIDEAIESSLALVVIMTPEARASEFVTYEWSYALGMKVEVVPVLLKKTELHPKLGELQYLDFSFAGARPWDKLTGGLREIEERYTAEHTPAKVFNAEQELLALRWLEMGKDQYTSGDFAKALNTYRRALQFAQETQTIVWLHYHLGYTFLQSGNLEQAEESLKAALAVDADYAEALAALGLLNRRNGEKLAQGSERDSKLDEADRLLNKALKQKHDVLDNDNESWWATLGGLYRRRGQIDKAIDAYANATKVTPNSSYPFSNLALLYLQQNNRTKMLETYRWVERLAQNKVQANLSDFYAHADLLMAQLALKKAEDAEKTLDFVITTTPADSPYALPGLRDNLQKLQQVLASEDAIYIQNFVERLNQNIQ